MFDNCNEYSKFDNIPDSEKLNSNNFICGLLKIQSLLINPKKFPCQGEHDTIYLANENEFKSFTQEDALYLNRCGFGWDSELDCLYKFT